MINQFVSQFQISIFGFAVLGFGISAVILPGYIKWLKQRKIEQFLREEGPKSHAGKAGTPSMGGISFILATVLATIGWMISIHSFDFRATVVMVGALVCGLTGFFDDSAKFRNKRNEGVSAAVRLGIETALGAALGVVLIMMNGGIGSIYIPSHAPIQGIDSAHVALLAIPSVLFVLLTSFLSAATTNAVNLHDGMDGLASGTTSQVLATLAIMLLATGQIQYAAIAAIAAGSVLGFLMFNKYPAKIFMGDTGSLFLGGLIASLVICGGLVLWFIPLSLIFNCEAVSVMAQVVTFKLTKPFTPEKPMSAPALILYKLRHRLPGEGKRIFRMAPLHHHFEALYAEKGIAEWQVVTAFWLIQTALCAVTLALFFLVK